MSYSSFVLAMSTVHCHVVYTLLYQLCYVMNEEMHYCTVANVTDHESSQSYELQDSFPS